ncbi:MAG TPA: FkbM family methyltransferase [Caulobacteraceae bacterium]
MLRQLFDLNPALRARARRIWRGFKPGTEPELGLLRFLAPAGATAIDVGANTGAYVEALVRLGCQVVAFEPNPTHADELQRMYGSDIRLIRAAASDQTGTATLRVPKDASLGGLGTIEAANPLSAADAVEVEVPLVRIDSLGLTNVAFVKMDVEGHELTALRGAEQLIRDQSPRILVEAEERHRDNAVGSIRDFLEPLGYEGFMLCDGLMTSIRAFDPKAHQSLVGVSLESLNLGEAPKGYVNNFLFVPASAQS